MSLITDNGFARISKETLVRNPNTAGALTTTEITQLYNGGNGLSYPFSSNNSAFFAFFA